MKVLAGKDIKKAENQKARGGKGKVLKESDLRVGGTLSWVVIIPKELGTWM